MRYAALLLYFVALGMLFVTLPQMGNCDVANVRGGTGGSLTVRDNQHVRMLRETIDIEIHEKWARFDVVYYFINTSQKSQTAHMAFPESKGEKLWYERLNDFKAWVDADRLQVRRVQSLGESESTPETEYVSWQLFEVHFAPGQQRTVRNSYWTYATDYRGLFSVEYILHTGSSWQGAIDAVEITARLKSDLRFAKPEDAQGWALLQPSGYSLGKDGKELVWSLRNIEPTKKHDLFISWEKPGYPYMAEAQKCSAQTPDTEIMGTEKYLSAWNVHDGDLNTSWAAPFQKNSPPSVQVDFLDGPLTVNRIGILGGMYVQDFLSLYTAADRVRQAVVIFSNGDAHEITLRDRPQMQYFDLPPTRTEFVRLEVRDTYPALSTPFELAGNVHVAEMLIFQAP